MIDALVISILCGFAWAIGGEQGFGKWKRSLLVALVFALKGLLVGIHPLYYIALIPLAYSYQLLFYDRAIKLIYPDLGKTDWIDKAFGWSLVALNGMIAAVFPYIYYSFRGDVYTALTSLCVGGLGFCAVVFLANTVKLKFPYCYRWKGIKLLCPEDSWWLSSFLFGILLGVI